MKQPIAVKRVSDKLVKLLKSYETGMGKNDEGDWALLERGKPALLPYQGESDDEGVLTIGWEHAMKNANEGSFTFSNKETINLYTVTESIETWQAEEILYSDIRIREEELNSKLVELNKW